MYKKGDILIWIENLHISQNQNFVIKLLEDERNDYANCLVLSSNDPAILRCKEVNIEQKHRHNDSTKWF